MSGASGLYPGVIEREFRASAGGLREDSVFVMEALRGTYS